MGQDLEAKNRRKSVTKTPAGRTGKPPKVEWVGFVQYEPNESDKRALQTFMSEGNDPLDLIEKCIGDGEYDLKVRYDVRNDCFAASLYCGVSGHRHAGYALAARASDPFAAMRRVLYLHTVVLEGEWSVNNEGAGWNDEKW